MGIATRTCHERSVEMARALQAAGVAHELVTLTGFGHVFDLEEPGPADPAVQRAFDRAVAFMTRYVGADGLRHENTSEAPRGGLPVPGDG